MFQESILALNIFLSQGYFRLRENHRGNVYLVFPRPWIQPSTLKHKSLLATWSKCFKPGVLSLPNTVTSCCGDSNRRMTFIHNCNVAAVLSCNVSIWYASPMKESFIPKGVDTLCFKETKANMMSFLSVASSALHQQCKNPEDWRRLKSVSRGSSLPAKSQRL